MRLLILLLSFLMVSCPSNRDKQFVAKKVTGVENIPQNWPWRGINIVSFTDTDSISEQDIHRLKKLGVNAVRVTIELRKFLRIHSEMTFEKAIDKNFDWCEKLIKWCSIYDIVVIVNSSDFPIDPGKDFNKTAPQFWNYEKERNAALQIIDKTVARFDKYKNVVAYDFFGEPVVLIDGDAKLPKEWNSFFGEIIQIVRKQSDKYLIYAPSRWGLLDEYSDSDFKPLADDKIIYGFHFYSPHGYTHQGIGKRENGKKYPGFIGFHYWNHITMFNQIEPAISWSEKYNKLLYVGEFGVVAWAEGRTQYLDDLLTILDKNRIGYTYWSYNGWKGWSPNILIDYSPTTEKRILKISPTKTETMKVLEKHWKNNQ